MNEDTKLGPNAIDAVANLVADQKNRPFEFEVNGQKLEAVPEGWTTDPVAKTKPLSVPVRATTLGAAVRYAKEIAAKDYINPRLFAVVEGPSSVAIISSLDEHGEKTRDRVFEANAFVPPSNFGKWLSQEDFMLWLLTGFVQTDGMKALQKFIGVVKGGIQTQAADDGVSQEVQVTKGAHLVTTSVLPNPVTLAPFRTFPEVDQPESLFAFRLKDNTPAPPWLGLFEADGGAWRREAIEDVAGWLEGEAIGIPVLA